MSLKKSINVGRSADSTAPSPLHLDSSSLCIEAKDSKNWPEVWPRIPAACKFTLGHEVRMGSNYLIKETFRAIHGKLKFST